MSKAKKQKHKKLLSKYGLLTINRAKRLSALTGIDLEAAAQHVHTTRGTFVGENVATKQIKAVKLSAISPEEHAKRRAEINRYHKEKPAMKFISGGAPGLGKRK